jgi:phosphoesterase RecJ-like protein
VEDTLKIAGELVSLGADITDISYRMFTNQSKERAKLHGRAMSNIKYFLDDRLAIITMFKKDFLETGAKREDTEGFIDFVMGIDTVKVGIALTEMDNGSFKASMRSKGPNVSAIAGVYGGGGHVLASGCQISGEYEEVVDKIRFAVSQHLE